MQAIRVWEVKGKGRLPDMQESDLKHANLISPTVPDGAGAFAGFPETMGADTVLAPRNGATERMLASTSAGVSRLSPHLQRLEDEAIHILREVVAEFHKPVMLYSVGKDSSVMLHLARKAFHPAPPPFPFLHIATGWDFRALLDHRDRMAARYGLELLVHGNAEAAREGVNPFETETGEDSRLM